MKREGYEGEFLSEEEIIRIHDRLAEESDDNEDFGFIDVTGDLFRGSVNSIFGSFFGQDVYPSVSEKACRLAFNIITAHCFKNVNKRTGLMAMILTFEMNGLKINLTEDELFEAITEIAKKGNEESWEVFKERIIGSAVKIK